MGSGRLCGNKVSHWAFLFGRIRDISQNGGPFLFLPWHSCVQLPPAPTGPVSQCNLRSCLPPGLKGTYQGLTATVLKQGSNQAIRFFVMTSLRNWYRGMCAAPGPHLTSPRSHSSPAIRADPFTSRHFLIATLPTSRGGAQQAHEPTDHRGFWSYCGCSQCLREHSSGRDQNPDAGGIELRRGGECGAGAGC